MMDECRLWRAHTKPFNLANFATAVLSAKLSLLEYTAITGEPNRESCFELLQTHRKILTILNILNFNGIKIPIQIG